MQERDSSLVPGDYKAHKEREALKIANRMLISSFKSFTDISREELKRLTEKIMEEGYLCSHRGMYFGELCKQLMLSPLLLKRDKVLLEGVLEEAGVKHLSDTLDFREWAQSDN